MQTLHAALAAAIRLVVALALIAAPWPNPDTAVASLAAPTDTANVDVGNSSFSFSPQTQTVLVGDTVHWVWTDVLSHSTTSGTCSGIVCTSDGTWNSQLHAQSGFTFDEVFTQTGTYQYFCLKHGGGGMRGTINVVEFLPITGLTAANSSPTVLGNTTDFTATISAGNSVTYTWSFGDGQGAVGALASHVYNNTGFYTAVVTASNPISTAVATTQVSITRNLYLPLILR